MRPVRLWPNSIASRRTRKATSDTDTFGHRSLRLYLLITVVVALSPVALVSVLQGIDRVQRDAGDVRESLLQAARATAGDEENVLAAGEQVLRALSNQMEVREIGP